jgi:NADH-quinone oxidoreductase subunit G
MAATAVTEKVHITVNDIDVEVPKGEMIVESVKRLGLEIPIFCYHPRMKPVGMCRMCLVEVGFKQQDGSIRKMPKPQAACTLPASEGMAIYTDTEQVHKDRRGVLEFLLINHPLDCPICDRGGECPLQNNTLFYGPSTSRFLEVKRHAAKAYPLSKYVTLDLERCIQCARCVRFTEEISGDSELAFHFRGASTQPATFRLGDFDSKFSGNVIEICPVGALTSTPYRFRARPWDLETKPGICTLCSNGCSIWFDYRKGKMVRINGRTNEAVNEEWTCDRGKFGHDFYNSPDRLAKPMVRRGDKLAEATRPEAYEAILQAFAPGAKASETDAQSFKRGNEIAAIAGGMSSNEDMFMLQRLFRESLGSNNLDHRFTKNLQAASDRLENKLGLAQVQSTIESFESRKGILVFGTSLADEEPILYLRVRKAWFKNGARLVVAHHERTDADSFADVVLRYRQGTAHVVAAGLLRLLAEGKDDKLFKALEKYTPEYVREVAAPEVEHLVAAAEALAENAAAVTTRSLMNLDHGQAIAEMLASAMHLAGGAFNLYSLTANGQGAEDLGILPDLGPARKPVSGEPGLGTHGILKGCAEGSVKALWLMNVDPFEAIEDRDLVVKALENVEFLVVQGSVGGEAVHYASVVLPTCAPAETTGTYTNIERRVQRFGHVLWPVGDAVPGWQIFSEVDVRLNPRTPYFNANEVFADLAAEVPMFAPAATPDAPADGVVLEQTQTLKPDLSPVIQTISGL